MGETLTCEECGHDIESIDDLETKEVANVEPNEDKSFNLFGNQDLFLCKDCKNPMGFKNK